LGKINNAVVNFDEYCNTDADTTIVSVRLQWKTRPEKPMKQIAIAILLLVSTGTAEGTIVVTTDSSTWLGVLTGGAHHAIDDFNEATGTLGNPATRTATGSPNRSYDVSSNGTPIIFSNALSTNNVNESLVLSNFSYTGSSVGFNVWLNTAGGDLELSVNGGSATTYTVGGSSGGSTFLGIYDDAGADITSVALTTSSGQFLTVDDLKFGTFDSGGGGGGGSTVPEPSSFALLGFGAIAGAFVVRRRRRVTETK